jgi:uroporphyrinogen-III synthase
MKRILITRPRSQADDFAARLRAAGYEPILFPVIEIKPVENNVALARALLKLECYDWIVFTSVNAVEIVFDHLPFPVAAMPLAKGRRGESPRVAAIGPKTAEALQARGVNPDLVPDEYVAESILPGLGDLRGRWVLLPRAEIARQVLPEAICEAGGIAHEITVYQTLPAQPDPEALSALTAGVDVVTLTSPSTVQNFVALAEQNHLDPARLPGNPLFACIGPITARAARDAGLANLAIAEEYTTEGLVKVLSSLEAI